MVDGIIGCTPDGIIGCGPDGIIGRGFLRSSLGEVLSR